MSIKLNLTISKEIFSAYTKFFGFFKLKPFVISLKIAKFMPISASNLFLNSFLQNGHFIVLVSDLSYNSFMH